ncbi:MAG TPA: hypothetical protein VN089_06330 [Duganella sp.]|nr:hypothetical protein [Duganella sp.]
MVQLLVNIDDEGMAEIGGRSIDPANITKEELASVLTSSKNSGVTVRGVMRGQTVVLRGAAKPTAAFLAVNGVLAGGTGLEAGGRAAGGMEAFQQNPGMPDWTTGWNDSKKAMRKPMLWTTKSAMRKMERAKARQEVARDEVPYTGVANAAQPAAMALDPDLAERQAKRYKALMKMRDLWDSGNVNLEKIDGVEYQKAMRAEW